MFNKKLVVSPFDLLRAGLSNPTVILALITGLFVVNTGISQSLEENFNDFLHYTQIGRFDLAKGYAQAILESDPNPLELFDLSQANPTGYSFLLRVNEFSSDAELVESFVEASLRLSWRR